HDGIGLRDQERDDQKHGKKNSEGDEDQHHRRRAIRSIQAIAKATVDRERDRRQHRTKHDRRKKRLEDDERRVENPERQNRKKHDTGQRPLLLFLFGIRGRRELGHALATAL